MFVELFLVLQASSDNMDLPAEKAQSALTNTEQIGMVLYTDYVYLFQLAGMILLVAMIGAIVLTLHHRPAKRQNIRDQLDRRREDTIEIVDVEVGKGV